MRNDTDKAGFLDRAPRFFKALCDPNRIAILRWLSERARPDAVRDIARCCPVDLSVVSRHLALMREAGILSAERRGREVLYSVNTREIIRILRALADYLESCCPPDCCRPPAERTGKGE